MEHFAVEALEKNDAVLFLVAASKILEYKTPALTSDLFCTFLKL